MSATDITLALVAFAAVGAAVGSIEGHKALRRRYRIALGDVEALEAKLDAVYEALSAHPRACDKHADGDPVSCGWKRAVLDVQAALDGDA